MTRRWICCLFDFVYLGEGVGGRGVDDEWFDMVCLLDMLGDLLDTQSVGFHRSLFALWALVGRFVVGFAYMTHAKSVSVAWFVVGDGDIALFALRDMATLVTDSTFGVGVFVANNND